MIFTECPNPHVSKMLQTIALQNHKWGSKEFLQYGIRKDVSVMGYTDEFGEGYSVQYSFSPSNHGLKSYKKISNQEYIDFFLNKGKVRFETLNIGDFCRIPNYDTIWMKTEEDESMNCVEITGDSGQRQGLCIPEEWVTPVKLEIKEIK